MIPFWATDTGMRSALVRYVDSRIGGTGLGFGNCQVLGIFEGATLAAAVVFHNFDPRAGVIEMSAAANNRRWLTRRVLAEIFGYTFDQAGCQMVVMRVSERNTHMCRIARAYGFEGVRIPRLRGLDEAEIVFTLTDDAWRASRWHKSLTISPTKSENLT